jgi:ribosomal protein S20
MKSSELKKSIKEYIVEILSEDEEDREPTKSELEKEKVKGAPSKFKVPQSDFEDFKTKLKTLVKKIKDMEKGDERTKKMAALKQFIKKPELVKAFKERDVQIDTGDLVG